MARLSGGRIGIMVAGTALAEVLRWECEETDVDVESTAAGDTVVDFTHLRTSFRITGECEVTVASPYVVPTGLVGTTVAFKGKVDASHTNGFVECTAAKVNRFTFGGEFNGMIRYSFELGPAGVGLTYDLSPAT